MSSSVVCNLDLVHLDATRYPSLSRQTQHTICPAQPAHLLPISRLLPVSNLCPITHTGHWGTDCSLSYGASPASNGTGGIGGNGRSDNSTGDDPDSPELVASSRDKDSTSNSRTHRVRRDIATTEINPQGTQAASTTSSSSSTEEAEASTSTPAPSPSDAADNDASASDPPNQGAHETQQGPHPHTRHQGIQVLAGTGYTTRKKGPKIYVYELPGRFNVHGNLNRLDRPLYLLFWQRLLSSGVRTANGDEVRLGRGLLSIDVWRHAVCMWPYMVLVCVCVRVIIQCFIARAHHSNQAGLVGCPKVHTFFILHCIA